MTVRVSIKKDWSGSSLKGLNTGVIDMVADIHKRASILAPKATRALVNSGLIKALGQLAYQISFGSGKVPYARLRHFENKKSPETLGYLAKAGDSVVRGDVGKYFRGKV